MRWFLFPLLVLSQPYKPRCPAKSSLTDIRTTTVSISGPGPHLFSGIAVSTTTGPCFDLQAGAKNVVIERSYIGPCADVGISLYQNTNVTIRLNTIENASSGVYALESSDILVENNMMLNSQGPSPRGQCFQSDKCKSPLVIRRNWCEQIRNQSNPEDNINLYQTNGTASVPVLVQENIIIGGGPSTSGCGILMGDGYGFYQTAISNTLVNAGQCGIGVASGVYQKVLNNTIYSKSLPWANTGLYVWNQYLPSPCSNVTVMFNQVNWTDKTGAPNNDWDNGNCGPVTGWAQNDFNSAIDPSKIPNSTWDNAGPCPTNAPAPTVKPPTVEAPTGPTASGACQLALVPSFVGLALFA